MQLHSLKPRHKNYHSTVIGRGGKRGKTSGRGGKGQTARAGHKIRPEMRDLIKKLPKRRGFGKNRSHTVREDRVVYAPINLGVLESAFQKGDTVSPGTLLEKNLVRAIGGRAPRVKILGTGELTKALVIEHCALSASARALIEKVGGTIHV